MVSFKHINETQNQGESKLEFQISGNPSWTYSYATEAPTASPSLI